MMIEIEENENWRREDKDKSIEGIGGIEMEIEMKKKIEMGDREIIIRKREMIKKDMLVKGIKKKIGNWRWMGVKRMKIGKRIIIDKYMVIFEKRKMRIEK